MPGIARATDAGRRVTKSTVRVLVTIPRRAKHRARFVSPNTQSMSLEFVPNAGGSPATLDMDLTPTTNGCGPYHSATRCTATVVLAPGSYATAVKTFDNTGETGTLLSLGNATLDVHAGKDNALKLTLDGVPHSIAVASTARAVLGTQAGGFTLYGTAAQNFTAVAYDADMNQIAGSGAPAMTVSVVYGSNWNATSPAKATPNVFSLTPPSANNVSASIKVTASFADSTVCAQSGATCDATFSVVNDQQKLFVLNPSASGTVAEYAIPLTSNSTTAALINDPEGRSAGSMAYDPQNGYVFVSYCLATCGATNPVTSKPYTTDQVRIYEPPFSNTGGSTTANVTISAGVQGTTIPIALDASGDLFIGNNNGSASEYKPPYTASSPDNSVAISGSAATLTVDTGGNLWIGDCNQSCGGNANDQLLEYASPYTGAPTLTITAGIAGTGKIGPIGVLRASNGTLFVANEPSNAGTPWGVLTFSSPLTSGESASETLSTAGVPYGIAVDGASDLFVAQCGTGCDTLSAPDAIYEYQPPYTSAITIDSGNTYLSRPVALAVDGLGDLLVANQYDANVLSYAPPYNAAPAAVSGAGVSGAMQLVMGP